MLSMHVTLLFTAKLYQILTNENVQIYLKLSQKRRRCRKGVVGTKQKVKNGIISKISINDFKATLHFVSQHYLSNFKKDKSSLHKKILSPKKITLSLILLMHLRLRFKAKLYKILTNANPHIQVKFSQKSYRKKSCTKTEDQEYYDS